MIGARTQSAKNGNPRDDKCVAKCIRGCKSCPVNPGGCEDTEINSSKDGRHENSDIASRSSRLLFVTEYDSKTNLGSKAYCEKNIASSRNNVNSSRKLNSDKRTNNSENYNRSVMKDSNKRSSSDDYDDEGNHGSRRKECNHTKPMASKRERSISSDELKLESDLLLGNSDRKKNNAGKVTKKRNQKSEWVKKERSITSEDTKSRNDVCRECTERNNMKTGNDRKEGNHGKSKWITKENSTASDDSKSEKDVPHERIERKKKTTGNGRKKGIHGKSKGYKHENSTTSDATKSESDVPLERIERKEKETENGRSGKYRMSRKENSTTSDDTKSESDIPHESTRRKKKKGNFCKRIWCWSCRKTKDKSKKEKHDERARNVAKKEKNLKSRAKPQSTNKHRYEEKQNNRKAHRYPPDSESDDESSGYFYPRRKRKTASKKRSDSEIHEDSARRGDAKRSTKERNEIGSVKQRRSRERTSTKKKYHSKYSSDTSVSVCSERRTRDKVKENRNPRRSSNDTSESEVSVRTEPVKARKEHGRRTFRRFRERKRKYDNSNEKTDRVCAALMDYRAHKDKTESPGYSYPHSSSPRYQPAAPTRTYSAFPPHTAYCPLPAPYPPRYQSLYSPPVSATPPPPPPPARPPSPFVQVYQPYVSVPIQSRGFPPAPPVAPPPDWTSPHLQMPIYETEYPAPPSHNQQRDFRVVWRRKTT